MDRKCRVRIISRGRSFGWKQNLDQFNGLAKEKTPNMLGYSGNVVAMFPGHLVVPYAAGGIGGTRLYRRAVLDIFDTTTLFTGNVGGGAKWFASGGRRGLRADYRFLATKSNDDAPEFFGREKRFGHRIYGGVVINAVK